MVNDHEFHRDLRDNDEVDRRGKMETGESRVLLVHCPNLLMSSGS